MATQNKLKDLLQFRNIMPTREVVKPVDLYTKPQVDETTPKQEELSIQADKPTNTQAVKKISSKVAIQTKPLVVKYTTHLEPVLIKSVKRFALEADRKDYEIVGEAVKEYLERHK